MNKLVKVNDWEVIKNPNDLTGIWITGEEVGRRLEYSDPRVAINKIFNRNQNFFKKNIDYSDVSLVSEAGLRNTRVFSQKGCVKVARYSRQPLADKVMDEVIDFFFDNKPNKSEILKYQDNPIIQTVIELEKVKERQEEIDRVQREHSRMIAEANQRAERIEAKAEHISDDKYWCVTGYAKCLGRKLTKDDVTFITFEAKRQSEKMRLRVKFMPHPQFTKINRYHEEALIAAFEAWKKHLDNGQMELFG